MKEIKMKKSVLLFIRKDLINKLKPYEGKAIINELIAKFIKKSKKDNNIIICCPINNKEFIKYRTMILPENYKYVKKIAKDNMLTVSSVVNYIIDEYL